MIGYLPIILRVTARDGSPAETMLYQCGHCGAAVSNPTKHDEWHALLAAVR